jgi:putative transposase
MPENASLSGCIGQFDLEFVEREATPRFLMKLGIQLHLSGLSLSNTVSILEIFGVERSRSTVHNWVHKADLQPESGHSPDHVAVDETVIQINNERYWLYAAVDPGSNELLHTTLEPTRTNALAEIFFAELRQKHDVDDVPRTACSSRVLARRVLRTLCFSSIMLLHYKKPAVDTTSISGTNATEIATVSNVSFVN